MKKLDICHKVIRAGCTLFVAGFAVLLCGCPSVRTQQLPGGPETVAVQGPYVHRGSGVTFPERVAHMERVRVLRYDPDGLDVSGGYNCQNRLHPLIATAYIHPSPPLQSFGSPPDVVAGTRARLAQREFEMHRDNIIAMYRGARLIEERDTVQVDGGQSHPGKVAIIEFEDVEDVFGFGGSKSLVRSHLYLFCYAVENWTVKYRFTHPKTTDASEDISAFMKAWHWKQANESPVTTASLQAF